MKLAKGEAARYLPGWCGPTMNKFRPRFLIRDVRFEQAFELVR